MKPLILHVVKLMMFSQLLIQSFNSILYVQRTCDYRNNRNRFLYLIFLHLPHIWHLWLTVYQTLWQKRRLQDCHFKILHNLIEIYQKLDGMEFKLHISYVMLEFASNIQRFFLQHHRLLSTILLRQWFFKESFHL